MRFIANEFSTDKPHGSRNNLFRNFMAVIGLAGRAFLTVLGLERITRIRASTLFLRIIIFNLIALSILLLSLFYFGQFKGGLVVCFFLLAVILSIVFAIIIMRPVRDLANDIEVWIEDEGHRDNTSRINIPDFAGRKDEIGRLGRAMRDMISMLYNRIDTNKDFAVDVAHEIKNPLASLGSAVQTLRSTPEGDSRMRLLDVIEHDVRRLDRLVSDISNTSRLDAESIMEQEEVFDLNLMLTRIVQFHTYEANDKGVELIWEQPHNPIMLSGLEPRLAQVFINLISNAISFCGKGDTVSVWVQNKNSCVMIVVEDTGPGIPDDALTKVFKRFYSERPIKDYGNNSGLGLSISKQIVEMHKGAIWVENIHDSDVIKGGPPLGARFLVSLPAM